VFAIEFARVERTELWFKKAIKVKYPDPLAVLYYADALKMNGSLKKLLLNIKITGN
jgi:hypothetical protein